MLRRSYRRQLINNEVLVKCMHQHWRLITRPIILTVLLALLTLTILATVFDSAWGKALLAVVAIVGLVVWAKFALPSLVRWYSVSYAVTSRRVLFRDGVVNDRFDQIDLVGVAPPVLVRFGWDFVFRSGTINLGGDHLMARIPSAKKITRIITELALANQSKDAANVARILKNLRLMT